MVIPGKSGNVSNCSDTFSVIGKSPDFELNLDFEERLRLESDYLLKDLMIGDTMRVSKWGNFCTIKNK